MFFGFTHCPDVCPATLLKLAQVRKRAALAGLRVVFVSIDPQRDTPALLGSYVHAFDPQFVGLTGDPATIATLAATSASPSAAWSCPGAITPWTIRRWCSCSMTRAASLRSSPRPLTSRPSAPICGARRPGCARRGRRDERRGARQRWARVVRRPAIPAAAALLSRWPTALTRSRRRWLKNALIRAFVARFHPQHRRCAAARRRCSTRASTSSSPARCATSARPADPDPAALISPVDGTVSQLGRLDGSGWCRPRGMPTRSSRCSPGCTVAGAVPWRRLRDALPRAAATTTACTCRWRARCARRGTCPGSCSASMPSTAAAVPGCSRVTSAWSACSRTGRSASPWCWSERCSSAACRRSGTARSPRGSRGVAATCRSMRRAPPRHSQGRGDGPLQHGLDGHRAAAAGAAAAGSAGARRRAAPCASARRSRHLA